MKFCELCKSPAKIYCDSDQASLCWTCDRKVHSANFLVARHSRSLLCRLCRSPTPWTASGEKLPPFAASFCEKCVVDGDSDDDDDREESDGENHNDDVDDEYDDETELDLDDEDAGDDNQVVPLSYPPPPSASSSDDDESVANRGGYLKRKRENVSDLSEEDLECLSVQKINGDESQADFSEEINYNYVIRHRNKISGEKKCGAVTSVSKGTRTVGLDLNRSDL